MSELDKWFDDPSNLLNDRIQAVDSAGCKIGAIDRPARVCISWSGEEQSVILKTPSAPDGWISTQTDSVDLDEWQ